MAERSVAVPRPGSWQELTHNWATVFRTSNLPAGARMDALSRWLLITRASVFTMTITSAAIGGLLAAIERDFAPLPFVLASVGLLLAHASDNMTNDLIDYEQGVDSPDYARAQYAPHPILSGLVSKRGLMLAILLAWGLAGAMAIALTYLAGWPVLVFAGLGFAISIGYVAKPLALKHRGLGELGIFCVWGPLMIGGTYFVTASEIAPWVFAASAPYGLLVATVIIGKHLDKYDQDGSKGIKTLVVLLGHARSIRLNQALMAAFFVVVVALVALAVLPVWTVLTLLALPRLVRVLDVYNAPKPSSAPEGYPIWPLWYVAWAFLLNRPAGYLFILSLILAAAFPLYVPPAL
jgi:1,4-dihydroxy-2-naphthoate octaprenyltransferase